MTPTEKEIFHLTNRVIALETKRAGDKGALDTLTEAVRVLQAARKQQRKLNAGFADIPEPVVDPTSWWDIFKR